MQKLASAIWYRIIITICFVTTALTIFSQNSPPSIKNLVIKRDSISKKLEIFFEINDRENDEAYIKLNLFANGKKVPADQYLGAIDTLTHVINGFNTISFSYAGLPSKKYEIQIVASDLNKPKIQDVIQMVDSTMLDSILMTVQGDRNIPAHSKDVKALIKSTFLTNNLTLEVQQFNAAKKIGENIIGHLFGAGHTDTTYLICAHFDSVKGSPGADDNASGITGMLELARILSKFRFRHSIQFVAFDMEEDGSIGSKNYVEKIHAKKINIAGVINLDMIGRYSDDANSQFVPEEIQTLFPGVFEILSIDSNRANFVLDISNVASRSLAETFLQAANSYVPDLKVVTIIASDSALKAMPDLASSDHARFWEAGFKSLHIGEGGPTRNTEYHSSGDTFDKINFQFIAKITKALLASIMLLAQAQDFITASATLDLTTLNK